MSAPAALLGSSLWAPECSLFRAGALLQLGVWINWNLAHISGSQSVLWQQQIRKKKQGLESCACELPGEVIGNKELKCGVSSLLVRGESHLRHRSQTHISHISLIFLLRTSGFNNRFFSFFYLSLKWPHDTYVALFTSSCTHGQEEKFEVCHNLEEADFCHSRWK